MDIPIIDFLLLAILGIVAWCVASEGAWTAAVTFLSILLSGLLAMNFFEPLANTLQGAMPGWSNRWDMVALIGLFIALVFGFRTASEYLAPTYISIHPFAHDVGRWFCGLLAGYTTMAFLLTALHTAPLPREFLGFAPEKANLFGLVAPDRQWLGLTQYVSEHSFGRFRYVQYPNGQMQKEAAHVFDGPRMIFGEAGNPYPNTVWPSFPMRYATRRERLGTPTVVTPVPVAPQQRRPLPSGGSAGF